VSWFNVVKEFPTSVNPSSHDYVGSSPTAPNFHRQIQSSLKPQKYLDFVTSLRKFYANEGIKLVQVRGITGIAHFQFFLQLIPTSFFYQIFFRMRKNCVICDIYNSYVADFYGVKCVFTIDCLSIGGQKKLEGVI
jgi:hypothetical protein